jgi:hypothetical protein
MTEFASSLLNNICQVKCLFLLLLMLCFERLRPKTKRCTQNQAALAIVVAALSSDKPLAPLPASSIASDAFGCPSSYRLWRIVLVITFAQGAIGCVPGAVFGSCRVRDVHIRADDRN